MAGEWSITVRDPSGAIRATYTPEHPVDSLWWSRSGDGGVVDAVIRGRRLDMRPRDIVTITAVDEVGSPFAPAHQYTGWVVQAGDRRDPNVTEWHLASGLWRLAELIETSVQLPAGDVSNLARAVAANLPPRIAGWPEEIEHIPWQGFELGAREPRRESKAEALQALADAVPGFVVPDGEAYAYDGATYGPGESVPPTTWGLRPAINPADQRLHVFFRRASGTLALAEVADALSIEWEPISGVDVIDRVHVQLYDRPSDGVRVFWKGVTVNTPFTPVEYLYEAPAVPGADDALLWNMPTILGPRAEYHAAKVVPVNPLDAMMKASWSGSASRTNLSNAGAAFDGDPTTYESSSGYGLVFLARNASLRARGARLHYSSFVPLRFSVMYRVGTGTSVYEAHQITDVPATNGDQHIVALLAPPTQAVLDAGISSVQVHIEALVETATPDQLRVYELEALQRDDAAAIAIAKSHVQYPVEQAGVVTIPNRLVPPRPKVALTLADASVVEANAGAYEYSITRDAGLQTSIRLNRDLPHAAYSERAALSARLERLEVRASRS